MFESRTASRAVGCLGTDTVLLLGHFAPASRMRIPFVGSLPGLLGQHAIQFPFRVRNIGLPQG